MRPPLQVCIGCRKRFYGYRNVCSTCLAEQRRESSEAVVDEIRARRQERIDSLEERPVGVPYGEFPEGF